MDRIVPEVEIKLYVREHTLTQFLYDYLFFSTYLKFGLSRLESIVCVCMCFYSLLTVLVLLSIN